MLCVLLPALALAQPADPIWIADWRSVSGFYETGLVAVAVEPATRCKDLVTTAGNDVSPQPLMMFGNRRRLQGSGAFIGSVKLPDWYSADIGFHTGLAAGLIDGDPFVDLVAVEFIRSPSINTNQPRFDTGAFKLYRGIRCAGSGPKEAACVNRRSGTASWPSFATSPAQRIGDGPDAGVFTFQIALGDGDGDGKLDLALPQLGNPLEDDQGHPLGPFLFHEIATRDPVPVRVRVYLNTGKNLPFAPTPQWTSDEKLNAANALFADLDQDGLMDLVVGADHVYAWFGVADASGRSSLRTKAEWVGARPAPFGDAVKMVATGLDTAWMWDGAAARFGLAVAFNCPRAMGTPTSATACTAGVATYFPIRAEKPQPASWISTWRGTAAFVEVADVDGDQRADLVFDSWVEDGGLGRLHIFRSQPDGGYDEKYFASAEQFVGEQLVVADFRGESRQEKTFSWSGDASNRHVFTLPLNNVEDVMKVERGKGKSLTTLPQGGFATLPGGNWVSLAKPLAKGETLRITYDVAQQVDIAVATWTAETGLIVYRNPVLGEIGRAHV